MKKLLVSLLILFILASPVNAAPKNQGTITVQEPVSHGETTTATTNVGEYVFVSCYNPEYVYAAYFPISNGVATLGPFTSSLWTSGPANCVAEAGFFRKGGFGKWVIEASTTFNVEG